MVGDLVPLLEASPPPGVELSPLHLHMTDMSASVERIQELLVGAVGLSDAAKFWIGDLLLFAANRSGEEGAIEAMGLSHDQAERYRLVCERVVRSRRKKFAELARDAGLPVPSWTHFRLLSRVPIEDQEQWFQRVLESQWSTREFEDRLRDARALEEVRKGKVPDARPTVSAGIVDAARAVGEIGAVLALADRALNGEHVAQEIADSLPRAAAAAQEIGRFVKNAGEGMSVLDAVGRVLESAVKQQYVADPAYIVPAVKIEALQDAYERAKGARR